LQSYSHITFPIHFIVFMGKFEQNFFINILGEKKNFHILKFVHMFKKLEKLYEINYLTHK